MKTNLTSGFQRHRTAIVLVSLILAVGCVWLWLFRSREPGHQGQPLSMWIKQLNEGDVDQRQAAGEAIRAMESRAIPALIVLRRGMGA